ncbi:CPBP family intramembrane glutamic endopeptidase [Pedosphaera parvula]|uniref:Abortive infection protein n=1 Tax=Pedosphaera parvula (strain Ellin514) TaxID=320771 RepID=B9XDK4_PEDPL|nr:CPBP family intramembrane glutamic endopeptidase [Pedosphaera parvula]EEF62150.1 Abortive infection protein [Pedosphaera parvula Ellin514]
MLSERPWKVDAVLRLVFGIFTCVCTILFISTLLQQVVLHRKFEENSLPYFLVGTLSLQGSILVGIAYFIRWQGISWTEAFGFFRQGLPRVIAWGLAVGLLFLPIGYLLQLVSVNLLQLVHYKSASQEAVLSLQKANSMGARVYLAFFATIMAPVAEECLFRGILYPTIKKYGGTSIALWSTSLAFAAIHANLPIFIPLTVFAMVLTWLYEKTDNLLACIIAHGLFNTIGVIAILNQPA